MVTRFVLGLITVFALSLSAQAQTAAREKTEESKPSAVPYQSFEAPKLPLVSPEQGEKNIAARGAAMAKQVIIDKKPVDPVAPGGNSALRGGGSSQAIPDRVDEIASGLRNNIDLIYQFVRDNIRYQPVYGLRRSAAGTALDQEGTAFEQAHLMVELLKTGGNYNPQYVIGTITLTGSQVADWLGVTGFAATQRLLQAGRIPATLVQGSGDTLTSATISHVWVLATVNGTNYAFDPSYKKSIATAGLDVRAAMGSVGGQAYSASVFVPSGGPTMSDARNKITGYATNLANHIRTNWFDKKLEEVIGTREIEPLPMPLVSLRQTSLPYQANIQSVASTLDNSYKATFRVFVTSAYDTNITSETIVTTDQMYGRVNYISQNEADSARMEIGGNSVWFWGANSIGTATFTLSMPDPLSQAGVQQLTWQGQVGGTRRVISATFGAFGRGHLESQRKIYRPESNPNYTVTGPRQREILPLFSYLAQRSQAIDLADQISAMRTAALGGFSLSAIAVASSGGGAPIFSPFVELLSSAEVSQAGRLARESMAHALSRTVAKQVGADSVSAHRITDANGGFQQVTQLPSNSYYSQDSQEVLNFVASGGKVYLSPGVLLGPGQNWSYAIRYVNLDQTPPILRQTISTPGNGVAGGDGAPESDLIKRTPSLTLDPLVNGAARQGNGVDMATGDFMMSRTDFTTGSEFGLALTLHYNSGARMRQSPLWGYGWFSDWDITAERKGDGFYGMGAARPEDAASAIASMVAAYDILKAFTDTGSPQRYNAQYLTAATMVQSWFADELIDNVVEIQQANLISKFVKRPDGTWNAPPGLADVLTSNANGWVITGKQGSQIEFKPHHGSAPLQQAYRITDTNGNQVNLAYRDMSQFSLQPTLLTVTAATGRSLSFQAVMDQPVWPGPYHVGSINVTDASGTRRMVYTANPPQGQGITYGEMRSGSGGSFSYPGGVTKFSIDYSGVEIGSACVRRTRHALDPAPLGFWAVNSCGGNGQQHLTVNTGPNTGSTWHYFQAGTRSELQDPSGDKTIVYYNERQLPVRSTDPLGNTAVSVYDGQDRLVSVTTPEGAQKRFSYDTKHNVLESRQKPKTGSSSPDLVATATYHSTWNKPLTVTDTLGRVASFSYNAKNGNLLSITSPSVPVSGGGNQQPVASMSYNARGQVLTVTGPDGMVTRQTYDATTGDPLSRIVDDGAGRLNLTASRTYDAIGNVKTMTNGVGNAWTIDVNADRRILKLTAPGGFGIVTEYEYDNNTRLKKQRRATGDVNNPWAETTAGYDADTGRMVTITDPRSFSTTIAYDNETRPNTITDAENRQQRRTFDSLGRVSQLRDSNNTLMMGQSYTPDRLVKDVKDGKNNPINYVWDEYNRFVGSDYADGTTERLTLDAMGRVLSSKNRQNETTTFTYDALDRVTSKTEPGGVTVSYEYDIAGRLKKLIDPTGTWTYGYDTAGRQIWVQRPDGKMVSYQYDAASRRTRLTWPDNYYVTYEYDAVDRLTAIKENGTATLAAYTYDALSRRTQLTYGNGAVAASTHDADGNVLTLTHTIGSNSASWTHTYDKTGLRLTDAVNDSALVWNPNAATQRRYTTNSTNQYADDGQYPLSYDARGNLTNDGLFALGYNAKNQLVSASGQGTNATYAYDALGRRASKTVNSNTTSFLYDGSVEIATYDNAGALKERVIPGPGLDNVLVVIAGSSKFYQHSDVLGSVMMVTDQAGVIVKKFSYGPYGETDTADTSPFRHAGRRFDAETGIYFNRARHYAPRLGRFLQPDPIQVTGGINIYVYAANNPIAFVDPSGLISCDRPNCMEVSPWLDFGQRGYSDPYNPSGSSFFPHAAIDNNWAYSRMRSPQPSQDHFWVQDNTGDCAWLSSGDCGFWAEGGRNHTSVGIQFEPELHDFVGRVTGPENTQSFVGGPRLYLNLSPQTSAISGSVILFEVSARSIQANGLPMPAIASPEYFAPVQHQLTFHMLSSNSQLVLQTPNPGEFGSTQWNVRIIPTRDSFLSEPPGSLWIDVFTDIPLVPE